MQSINSPLFSTARHSSSLFWTGYDILLESALALELNRPPMKGMFIDLREIGRWGRDRRRGDCCEARVRVKLERVYRVRSTLENWKRIKKMDEETGGDMFMELYRSFRVR